MREKKPGLFGRLFGRKPDDEQKTVTDANADSSAPVDAPASDDAPAPETRDTHEPDLGPPESTDEWLSKGARHASETVETENTPPAPPTEAHPHASPASPEMTLDPEDVDQPDEPETAPAPEPEAPGKKPNWLRRLASGLKRTSDNLTDSIGAVFTKRRLDDETLEELEDVLIQADLGIDTAMAITEKLAADRYNKEITTDEVRAVLAAEVEAVLAPVAQKLDISSPSGPFVLLMVGVNGSGKTTTIGKLAQKFAAEGKSVMLAAGDTFRAAAIEQLQVWGQRTNTPVVARPAGADASGLAFDAVQEATAAQKDVLIIDTAGRLQNRDELMAELEKIIRVIKKQNPDAPHAVLLTLDATTGQNALQQVEIFGKRAGVTGLVMTKLDGTARGGILAAIAKKYALPVHYIGVGEGVDDLEPFEAADFAAAIAGSE